MGVRVGVGVGTGVAVGVTVGVGVAVAVGAGVGVNGWHAEIANTTANKAAMTSGAATARRDNMRRTREAIDY